MTDPRTDPRTDPLVDPFATTGERWLTGRRVLVTGGGQTSDVQPGVGYAISRTLAAHGAAVAVLDRDPDAAGRTVERITAEGGTAVAVGADLLDDDACRRAVHEAADALGGLDGLVNNVAAGDRAGVLEVTPERFHQLMDLNLTTAWQTTRHAAELLGRGASVVNISSVGVRARGPAMVYNLAKSALENLTVGLANTLGPAGVRVNCVQVGAIWGAFAAANIPESMREVRRGWSALRTEGTPWDIAQATLFLTSDRARWVSGQILSVDGGPSTGAPPIPPPAAESGPELVPESIPESVPRMVAQA